MLSASLGNYLRVRGEYNISNLIRQLIEELPPRARRILVRNLFQNRNTGTTSACAENTVSAAHAPTGLRNYLRVRGEYQKPHLSCAFSTELPPRARRIHQRNAPRPNPRGTTSACAENTGDGSMDGSTDGNYLRVRGEYETLQQPPPTGRELPPRARRILGTCHCPRSPTGTTSACAENTAIIAHGGRLVENYLRVRGEYYWRAWENRICAELPPRARRILNSGNNHNIVVGTTSACAENTACSARR